MKQTKPWYFVLAALAVILLVAILLGVVLGSMPATPASTDPLPGIAAGGKVSVVGQIVKADSRQLAIELLAGADHAQHTGRIVVARRAGESIVQGSEQDLVVGAVAQFDGIKTGDDTFDLNRIALLASRGAAGSPTP